MIYIVLSMYDSGKVLRHTQGFIFKLKHMKIGTAHAQIPIKAFQEESPFQAAGDQV